MKGTLRVKTTIRCETCNCRMTRRRTFKVEGVQKDEAKALLVGKAEEWKKSLAGQNCAVCQSIINS